MQAGTAVNTFTASCTPKGIQTMWALYMHCICAVQYALSNVRCMLCVVFALYICALNNTMQYPGSKAPMLCATRVANYTNCNSCAAKVLTDVAMALWHWQG